MLRNLIIVMLALWLSKSAMAETSQRPDPLQPLNKVTFRFNAALHGSLDAFGVWLDQQTMRWWEPNTEPESEDSDNGNSFLSALGHATSNLVNEPVTLISSVIAVDPTLAWNATARFTINSTLGLLGTQDRAEDFGFEQKHIDLGLALCAYGVPSGPYLMSPFVGPRSVRDAVADIGLMNAVLYSLIQVVIGPTNGLQTFIIVESTEAVADTFGTRQIDEHAKALKFDDYDQMREDYFIERKIRCDQLREHLAENSLLSSWFQSLDTEDNELEPIERQ